MPSEPSDAPPPPWRRRLGAALLLAGALVLVLLVWAGIALAAVGSAAQVAADRARDVTSSLGSGQTSGALAAARSAAVAAERAHERADALPLRLASHLPVTGPLLSDARALTAAADTAVGDGAVPVLEAVDRLAAGGDGAGDGAGDGPGRAPGPGLLREDGSVDVTALTEAGAVVHRASAALGGADARAAAVDPGRFPRALREDVAAARSGIRDLARAVARADPALASAPGALGADGPRDYLVVFQNPAELRPTGGLLGTWASLSVDDGRVELTEVGANDDLTAVRAPAASLGEEQRAVYGDGPVRLSNANLSPDFTVAAPLLAGAWVSLGRPEPDAVVAVDPQGMAPLLGDTTLEVPGGPAISADTVVDVLLRRTYLEVAGDDARNAYLSTVVGTVFTRALGDGALTPATLAGVARAASGGHVLAWSPDEDLQAVLSGAGLAGALPAPEPGSARVHLTNVDGSKLDYFLTLTAATTCPSGAAPASLALTLRNDAPEQVPPYVASKLPGAAPTTHTVQVALYVGGDGVGGADGPGGAVGVDAVEVAGAPVGTASGTEARWRWSRFDVDLPRGEDVDVTALVGGPPLEDVVVPTMVRPASADVAPCAR